MEAPPVFNAPGPPPKRSNTLLIIVLSVLGLCAVCCIGGIFVVKAGFDKMKGFIGCGIHYPFVRLALKDYAAAHGGKLPDAAKWQDEIAPYYLQGQGGKNIGGGIMDFGDPKGDLGCKAEDGVPATGIAYNDAFSGLSIEKARENPSEILLFEVPTTGRNQHMKYKAQTGQSPQKMFGNPRPWITLPVQGNLYNQPSAYSDPKTGGL